VRAAILQARLAGLAPVERLNRLAGALEAEPVDLMVCAELFMSGYDVGDALAALAEPADGPFAREVAALARSFNTAIAYGYPEAADGVVYNAAACIDAAGNLVANHRKLMLPPGFEKDHFATGDAETVFDLGDMRLALLICYDAEYPEAVRSAATSGAHAVIVPTALGADWGSVSKQLIPTRAFENGVWLLYANHAGEEGATQFFGGSCIVAPDGSDAVRASDGEEIIAANLDIDRVLRAQARLPYVEDAARLRGLFAADDEDL